MILTKTLWNQERLKKNLKFLNNPRKEKLDRILSQIQLRNQTLTVRELTEEDNRINKKETLRTSKQNKLNLRCPSSLGKMW